MNLSRFLVPHQLCLRCLKFFCFVHEWQDSILHRIPNHALLRIIGWGKNQVHHRPLELLVCNKGRRRWLRPRPELSLRESELEIPFYNLGSSVFSGGR